MIDKSMCEPKEERTEMRFARFVRFVAAATLTLVAAEHFGLDGYAVASALYLYIEGLRHDH